MKSALRRWVRALLDPFGVQLYFILFTFLNEIPLVSGSVSFWKKVGLVWAMLVIVYDLFTRRRCLKARFALLSIGLLVAYGCTVVAVWRSFPTAFQETYLDWFCSIVVLLVLYPPTTTDRQRGLRRLECVNWLLIVLTSVVALVGIWMFAVQMGGYYYSDITDYNYPVGFINPRLTGLYRNAIYPTALIGMMAAVVEWTQVRGRAIVRRLLLVLAILINTLHLALSNSRSTAYALALFWGVVALFSVRDLLRRKKPGKVWRTWVSGALCAVVSLVLAFVFVPALRLACAYLPAQVRHTFGTVESPFLKEPVEREISDNTDEISDLLPDIDMSDWWEETPEDADLDTDTNTDADVVEDDPDGPIDWNRNDSESHGALTGRPIIWRQGWAYFLQRPVLGYGPSALKDVIRLSETSTEQLSHFHNIFLQSLVSVGIFGSIFFFLLLGGVTWRVLRRLLGDSMEGYGTLVAIGAMLAALLLINMADTTLFFLSKNSEFVFWSYLGYAMLLMDDAPSVLDWPVRWADDRLPRLREI